MQQPAHPVPRSRRRWLGAILGAGAALVLVVGGVALAGPALAATAFSDNFESGLASTWAKSGGTWASATDGSQVLQQSNSGTGLAREFNGSTSLTDYSLQASVKPLSLGSGDFVGIAARASSATTFYRLALIGGGGTQLQAVNSGAVTVIGSSSLAATTGTWYTLRIDLAGTSVKGFVNGTQVASGTSSAIGAGRIGLQTFQASANFDNVTVTTGAVTPPTTAPPTTGTIPPTSPSPTGPGSTPTGAWPTKTGDVTVTATIPVSGTLDGGLKRYCCIGDGGQSESQDPMFELADGAVLKNVIIGSPAGDGVHCLGRCTIQNVWWEDVGEDAATFLGTNGDSFVIGGGARSASDKVFQHNGSGTVHISGFYARTIGKLYRACGNCTVSHERHVVVDNVLLDGAQYVVGININWGDTAALTRITLVNGSSTHVCAEYTGVAKGSEPPYLGDGVNDGHCVFTAADITRR